MLNYDDYIALFNTGDDAALIERFFADDVVFSGGSRDYQGKAALKGFLDWAHDGVREVMRPQNVLVRGDLIFAEIDMDFHATRERPEFPFGHLRPGDLVTVKFFVTYKVRDGKVVELKSMTWPPGKGVSNLPRLGAHPSQLAAFRSYVAAFSNAEFERFPKFYTQDVLLELGLVRMRGRRRTPGRPVTFGTTDGFLEHYGLANLADLPGAGEMKALGLLSLDLPAGFDVPDPSANLAPDEDPLEPGEAVEFHQDYLGEEG